MFILVIAGPLPIVSISAVDNIPQHIGKEIVITGEPLHWSSLNRQNHFIFYIIKSNYLDVALDKISAKSAALTNVDVLKLRDAGFSDKLIIDRINSMPSAYHLEMNDMIALKRAGISDAVIQAMLHAK